MNTTWRKDRESIVHTSCKSFVVYLLFLYSTKAVRQNLEWKSRVSSRRCTYCVISLVPRPRPVFHHSCTGRAWEQGYCVILIFRFLLCTSMFLSQNGDPPLASIHMYPHACLESLHESSRHAHYCG